LFRAERRERSKGKKGEREVGSKDRKEKCLVGHTGALYRAVKEQKTEERKERKGYKREGWKSMSPHV
jgi:hypothetical protein